MTKRPAVGIVLLSAALATGACSASVGTPQVDKSEVASQISTQLAEKIGEPPDDVTCPEVGASITCILTEQGTEYDVTATVTSVDGESANFDIKVADVPNN
ncbi:DUF4333 domain-containing protein [Rhodococcus sp. (in: high G+C Gram-positive bacteria)]|uniref:DUF4333 domain-containing protein n=1 Tax=Rhodococcus sp. TaxID=1831 RepID=UPI0025881619|nr:DUF4333 domain-containing protein [Rhodococcus sp. (in: high G+C Gram-positive bacteria)]MCX6474479.1 DUF4333 domain-containing protein [Rhodococcus sp. (in: high G+C Gram-positive bacteria)]